MSDFEFLKAGSAAQPKTKVHDNQNHDKPHIFRDMSRQYIAGDALDHYHSYCCMPYPSDLTRWTIPSTCISGPREQVTLNLVLHCNGTVFLNNIKTHFELVCTLDCYGRRSCGKALLHTE